MTYDGSFELNDLYLYFGCIPVEQFISETSNVIRHPTTKEEETIIWLAYLKTRMYQRIWIVVSWILLSYPERNMASNGWSIPRVS